jgi:hypothetical protein
MASTARPRNWWRAANQFVNRYRDLSGDISADLDRTSSCGPTIFRALMDAEAWLAAEHQP